MNLGLQLYIISLLSNLQIIFEGAFYLLIAFFFIALVIGELSKIKKYYKLIICVASVVLFGCIILPNKDDMYKIMIAGKIGTVDQGTDAIKSAVDYVVESINKIKK